MHKLDGLESSMAMCCGAELYEHTRARQNQHDGSTIGIGVCGPTTATTPQQPRSLNSGRHLKQCMPMTALSASGPATPLQMAQAGEASAAADGSIDVVPSSRVAPSLSACLDRWLWQMAAAMAACTKNKKSGWELGLATSPMCWPNHPAISSRGFRI